jgi:hypothetical protein
MKHPALYFAVALILGIGFYLVGRYIVRPWR